MSVRAQVSSSRYSTCLYLQLRTEDVCSTLRLVANEIAYRLQPLERSPGVFLASARLSGPRTPLGFPSGLRSRLPLETSFHPPTLCYYPRALRAIPFVETRQSAFIFQA